jgi:hypothetical protein
MERRTENKIIIMISIIIILLALPTTFHKPIKKLWKTKITPSYQEEWITIFVHGTFGSALGLLSFFDVIQDNIEDTTYKKIIEQMRKNPHFFATQPMLERGLVKVEPTFDLSMTKNNKYVVYPISKTYETILETIKPNKEKNHFYTFGWSGLFSQKRRRQESIRFYNALSEEIEKFKEQGIQPKIRILAHSHGGNVALNFAGIKTVIQNLNSPENLKKIAKTDDEQESLLLITETIKKLEDKQLAKTKKEQKVYDYLPLNQDLIIDELIMFGTPIQPETESFAFNPNMFKKVYNFYSDEDIVQKMDWVSTKRYYSDQRLSLLSQLNNSLDTIQKKPHVIQARIMFDHKFDVTQSDTLNAPNKKNDLSLLGRITNWLFSKKSNDPTHRDLWFAWWKYEKETKENNLYPLPVAIITPLFLEMIETISTYTNDIDININFSETDLIIDLLNYNEKKVRNKATLPRKLIEEIKQNIKKWEPDELSQEKEFDIINRYSSNL